MEIVLACDLVVASTTATFGLPEVQRSLVPTCAGMFRAPRALPLNVARELMLTGDPIDADRAERLGFVNRVVPAGAALDEAVALAQRICRNGPVGVRETMKVLERAGARRRPGGVGAHPRGRGGHLRGRRHQGGRVGLLRAPRAPLDRPLITLARKRCR